MIGVKFIPVGQPELTQDDQQNGQIIKSAMLVFWRHGYSQTNFSELVVATGMSRKYIYRYWRDKLGFFEACLNAYRRYQSHSMLDAITDINGIGVEALVEFFSHHRTTILSEKAIQGCLMIKTIAEMSDEHKEIDAITQRYLILVKGGFYNSLKLGQEGGEIATDYDIEPVVEFLFSVFIVIGSIGQNTMTKELVLSMIEQVLLKLTNITIK